MTRRRGCGFTLVEVLIALAVLAVAMAAAVRVGAGTAGNQAYLRDRTFAHWVAMNEMARLHLAAEWPGLGTREGEAMLGDRSWHWRMSVIDTPDARIRRADVEVRMRREDAEPLARLAGFVGEPGAARTPP